MPHFGKIKVCSPRAHNRIDEPDLVDDGFAFDHYGAGAYGVSMWPGNQASGQCYLITVVGFLSHASPVIAIMDGTSIMPIESQVKSA
jgi:hypothetical protein